MKIKALSKYLQSKNGTTCLPHRSALVLSLDPLQPSAPHPMHAQFDYSDLGCCAGLKGHPGIHRLTEEHSGPGPASEIVAASRIDVVFPGAPR